MAADGVVEGFAGHKAVEGEEVEDEPSGGGGISGGGIDLRGPPVELGRPGE